MRVSAAALDHRPLRRFCLRGYLARDTDARADGTDVTHGAYFDTSDTLYFEATAPETSLPQLRPGLAAEVSLDAVPGRKFPGIVRDIIPVAEATNRSVRLRISLPRTVQSAAVVGGFARAEIQGQSAAGTLSVPRAAVVSDEGQLSVFVVESARAVRRPVTVADIGGTGERVSVTAGLRAGDTVVVDGASSLTDGQPVKAAAGKGL